MGNSDSQASFVDGVKRLLDEDVSDDDVEFWTALFTAPMSADDVFDIIEPAHVRQLRQQRPLNLQVFLRRIIKTMEEISEVGDKNILPPSLKTTANTIIRLLTRVVPFLLETSPGTEDFSGNASDAVVFDILWRRGGYKPEAPPPEDPGDPEAVAAAADGEENGEPAPAVPETAQAAAATGEGQENGGPGPAVPETVCAEEILWQLSRLLFLPSFTCIPREGPAELYVHPGATGAVDGSVAWKGGVGAPRDTSAAQSQVVCGARAEVLRCLLSCLSGPLFQTSHEFQGRPPLWLQRFTGGEMCHTANLFCSLMSTVFDYDPVGWGVPYGGYFHRGSEEDLVDAALQLLCVVMDFEPRDDQDLAPSQMLVTQKSHASPQKASERHRNVYRQMLQQISKDEEIDFIFNGLVRLLSTVYQANQTYLPNSFRPVDFFEEALILLWHLITMNQAFMKRVAEHLDTNQIILPVLYLLQMAQGSQQLLGLLHTASFVLLILTAERSVGVRLNEVYKGKIPFTIPKFTGNHADVLMLTLHKAISENVAKANNDALIEIMLTVVCNVSPYVKCFALESCLKMLSLIERFSRPAYLFRSPFACNGLAMLIEMANNILQYQYEGNTMFVYSVLRQKHVFDELAALELPSKYAVAEEPEAADASTSPPDDSASPADDAQDGADDTPPAPGAAEDGARENGDEQEGDPREQPLVGKAWRPNPEWLAYVKKKLVLEPIISMTTYLGPRVETMCVENEFSGQDEVVGYLKTTTMVGILPVPHPITIRTYQGSTYTSMWFTSYLWGVIFTRSNRIYDWRKIRLVEVRQ